MLAKSPPTPQPTPARLGRWLGALALSLVAVSAAHAQVPLPPTPAGVVGVVAIQPFSLQTAYLYDWLAGRPEVRSGLLLVLEVDPRYVHARDAAEPVLYAGDVTVQRLNQGERSRFVVGIVPGKATLATVPVFFGRPELPERVTPGIAAAEGELAERAGIRAFTAEEIERALLAPVSAGDLGALLRGPAADLVLRYSPDERELAEDWRQGAGSH